MEVRTSSNTAEMSTIYIVLGVTVIVGVMLLGPLFGRVNGLLLLSVCFLMMALFGGLSPTWPSLVSYQALSAVWNSFFSATDTGELRVFLCHVLLNHTQAVPIGGAEKEELEM